LLDISFRLWGKVSGKGEEALLKLEAVDLIFVFPRPQKATALAVDECG